MAQRSSVNYSCIKFHKNPTKGLVSGDHLQVYGQTADGRGLHIKCYFLLHQKRPKMNVYIL